MTEIQGIARLKIHAGKLDEFKRLQTKCLEIVRAKDTGTVHYAVYFNSDETECIVHEHYRDSEALLEHIANLGDTMHAIFETCTGSGEILGTPSPALVSRGRSISRLAAADRTRPCFPAPSPDDTEALDTADPTPCRP